MLNQSSKPNYGIDALGVSRNFLLIGIVVAIEGWFLPSFNLFDTKFSIGFVLCGVSLVPIALGISMLVYGVQRKFNVRNRMLNLIEWQGDETVLDMGTGRGLLMIGAAERLTTGKAIGIDIWNAEDLTGNSTENTLKNAELENVKDRIEIRSEDVPHMSLADDFFDVVLSLLCLHNAEGGWLRALLDPQMSVVLGLIHHQPAHSWTVESLAKQVNLSRSAFAARLKTLVGEAPLQYLSRWRTHQSARLLCSTPKPLREITESVGYESEAAFSQAFKRQIGRAPGEYRQRSIVQSVA